MPSFEKACQVMFRQINETFERGLQEHRFGAAEPRPDILGEQMKLAVQTLLEVSTNMSKAIVDTQVICIVIR